MLNEGMLGQLESECYMVQRGKPAALAPIKKSMYMDYKVFVEEEYNLKVLIQDISEEWVSFYIYKSDYIKEIIESLPEKPESIFDHWVLGKLFGYSDEAINEFLKSIFI